MTWRKRLQRVRIVLPFIGIAIFIYIVYDIGVDTLYNAFAKVNPYLFACACLLSAPRIVLSTYKWRLVAKQQGIDIGLFRLVRINLIGLFYGTITPSGLGDWIRIFYIKNEKNTYCYGTCASNVVIDQIIEVFSLFILAIAGSIIVFDYFPEIFITLLVCCIVFVAMVLILKDKQRSERLLKVIYDVCVPDRLKASIVSEFDAFYRNIPPFSTLVIPFIIGIFCYTFFFIQVYIVALSFSISLPLIEFILIASIASFIGLVPITVSGLGTREGALIHLLGIYGVTEATAVAISLMGYLVNYLFPSMVGGVLSVTHQLKYNSNKGRNY